MTAFATHQDAHHHFLALCQGRVDTALQVSREHYLWLADEIAKRESMLNMIVARLGGTVESNPTARHNLLQRIDALRKIEKRALIGE